MIAYSKFAFALNDDDKGSTTIVCGVRIGCQLMLRMWNAEQDKSFEPVRLGGTAWDDDDPENQEVGFLIPPPIAANFDEGINCSHTDHQSANYQELALPFLTRSMLDVPEEVLPKAILLKLQSVLASGNYLGHTTGEIKYDPVDFFTIPDTIDFGGDTK